MTFLSSLNNRDTDGRIILDPLAGTLKFVLLNAAAQFSEVGQPLSFLHIPGSFYLGRSPYFLS